MWCGVDVEVESVSNPEKRRQLFEACLTPGATSYRHNPQKMVRVLHSVITLLTRKPPPDSCANSEQRPEWQKNLGLQVPIYESRLKPS